MSQLMGATTGYMGLNTYMPQYAVAPSSFGYKTGAVVKTH